MIKGHGDDAYQYEGISITSDFSSNICPQADHSRLAAHLAARGQELIGHYPEPEAWSLERMLAERHGVHPGCVVVTAGATDAIYLVAQAFRYRPLVPAPTFSEYEDACRLFPAPPDDKHYCFWLCNPNNPTGRVTSAERIGQLAVRNDLVVVDQSYEHYTDGDVLSVRQAMTMQRVVLLHSMTKTYGVPGLRLGYITAPLPIADALRRCLRPWAVSALAIDAGKYLLEHHDELAVHPDLAEARRLHAAISAIDGISAEPTQTNFMLCRLTHDGATAAELKDRLARRHGLLIRDASNFRGLTPQHFRIAAQSPQENDKLIQCLTPLTPQN